MTNEHPVERSRVRRHGFFKIFVKFNKNHYIYSMRFLPRPPFPAFFVNGKAGKGRDLKTDSHIFPFNEKKERARIPIVIF